MKELLIANWFVVLLAVAFLSYVIFLIITKQWETLKKLAYTLMLQAERAYSEDEGKRKFDYVFTLFYNLMPTWLKSFLTQEYIREKLQDWYDEAKKNLLK